MQQSVAMSRDLPAWAAAYIGLPFRDLGRDRDGVDCWGGIRLVLMEQAGVEVPAGLGGYSGTTRADIADIARVIDGGRPDYIEIATGWDGRGRERPFDLVLMKVLGRPFHIGIVVARGWMLHVEKGTNMAAGRYREFPLRDSVLGFYRHRALTVGA